MRHTEKSREGLTKDATAIVESLTGPGRVRPSGPSTVSDDARRGFC